VNQYEQPKQNDRREGKERTPDELNEYIPVESNEYIPFVRIAGVPNDGVLLASGQPIFSTEMELNSRMAIPRERRRKGDEIVIVRDPDVPQQALGFDHSKGFLKADISDNRSGERNARNILPREPFRLQLVLNCFIAGDEKRKDGRKRASQRMPRDTQFGLLRK